MASLSRQEGVDPSEPLDQLSPLVVTVFFDNLLALRAIQSLLDWGEARLEQPTRRFIARLRETHVSLAAPWNNLIRRIAKPIPGTNDRRLLNGFAGQVETVVAQHLNLRHVGKFPVPRELETAFRFSFREMHEDFPEEVFFSATDSIRIIEEAPNDRPSSSVLRLPALFTVLPIYWPLLAHEFGHHRLRRHTGLGTTLGHRIGEPSRASEQSFQAQLPAWRGEAASDRMGLLLFGPAFVAPFVSYCATFESHQLGSYTATHPAPVVRLKLLAKWLRGSRCSGVAGILDRLDALNSLVEPSADHEHQLICVACNKPFGTASSRVIVGLESELEDAASKFEESLNLKEGVSTATNSDQLACLVNALAKQVPVDLAFLPEKQASNEAVKSFTSGAEPHLVEDALSKIRPRPVSVRDLFLAAWRQRYSIESEAAKQIARAIGNIDAVEEVANSALRSLIFLNENIAAGIRSLEMISDLAEEGRSQC